MTVSAAMGNNNIRSVVSALAILDAIGEHHSLGVRDIARVTGLPRSSVQRSLETLWDVGWIEPSGAELRKWRLTSHILRLARAVSGEYGLRHAVLPVMERLRKDTLESIHLCVPDGNDMVLIERLESPQPVRTFIELGIRVPVFASAVGKAAASTWSDEKIAQILSLGLTAHTELTVTSKSALLHEIRAARQLGYAVNRGEWRNGVTAVAAPIRDNYGNALASISVSAPSSRTDDERRNRLGPLVRDAAKEAELKLHEFNGGMEA